MCKTRKTFVLCNKTQILAQIYPLMIEKDDRNEGIACLLVHVDPLIDTRTMDCKTSSSGLCVSSYVILAAFT